MPYNELKKIVYALYKPALTLRRVFPAEVRQKARTTLSLLTLLAFIVMVLAFAIKFSPIAEAAPFSLLSAFAGRAAGIFFLLFSGAFTLSSLEAFHRSYYFHGLAQVLKETAQPTSVAASWEVGTIVDSTTNDVVHGFLTSDYGQEIIYRSGVTEESFITFLKERTNKIHPNDFKVEQDQGVTLRAYVRSLYKQDPEFKKFLAQNNIGGEQFETAAEWVTTIERKERQGARWWSRDNLGRIPGLGKSFSYGETYLLEKYGHDLTQDHIWPTSALRARTEDDEVEAMEQVLARARQSNVLILGEDATSVRQSVACLYRKIRNGNILPPLEAKRIFFIDLETVVTASQEKTSFERELRKMMDQAVSAGNVIMYFEHLLSSIASANAIGADLVDVLAPYFESDNIQIIASSNKDGFHGTISRDNRIMQVFDVVHTHEVSEHALVAILEQRAIARERQTRIVFTVPALFTIARLADRYFPSGVMPDKAFDLLEELIPLALSHGLTQILQSTVEELVYEKTGVPMGDPTEEERAKLLSLEDFLHKRVVGQEHAVGAVAQALRRARAGVGSAEKPMGTFLFLGPTGVGKTETAKALAEALFGDEHMMNRLDMSEFQGADALEELIGSFETGKPGRLATLIREQQYGVLLLDEFEKSSHNVHDLFLQVLDEGVFTDAAGKSVNARNLIIIATSNAGADLIWQWEKEGKDIVANKRILVDHIISEGMYRPEFLNRFDDIIVFHPLKQHQVQDIARIHLTHLANRLSEERNIELEVTDELVARVAEKGYDPQFGGRPLTRAIKEEVEQAIADSLLAGTIHSGDSVNYDTEKPAG